MKKRFGIIMFLAVLAALLAAVACGADSTAPVPTQPPPAETPIKGPPPPTETPVKGNPPPEEPVTIEVPAPIDDATLVTPTLPSGGYILKITSGLPSGCARFNAIYVGQDGNRFLVEVTNLVPNPKDPIACAAIYGFHEGEAALGDGLDAGEAYTVTINGELTHSFTVLDADAIAMIEKESPIEEVGVMEADGGYLLTIVSRLPLGSSCSRFNGYEINRRSTDRVEVTVTHREVAADDVPCTDDLPAVFTEIHLGADFVAGTTYTVSVNGVEAIFTAR